MNRDYRNISFWFAGLEPRVRPKLTRDLQVDVAIAGAGFTGLWTAYYLKHLAPELSIAILEAETAGFGASGRNGGWLMGSVEGMAQLLEGLPPARAAALRDSVRGIVPEVRRVLESEQIDCDFYWGGGLFAAARFAEQLPRARVQLAGLRAQGFDEDDYRWLDAAEAAALVHVRDCRGGVFTPHVATVHPLKLVCGLARCLEERGVMIFEQSPVTALEPRRLQTAAASVSAGTVVSALEAWSATPRSPFPRHTIPVASKVLVTEPLPPALWDEIGFARRPAFSDQSRLISYAQRTADDRLLFGARGSYQLGAKVRRSAVLSSEETQRQRRYMLDFFPALEKVDIAHAWAGSLGMARGFRPHALVDRDKGLALGGGYTGEGVGASNLIARTLADLILGRDSILAQMPWAHSGPIERSLPYWEPEPLRWLGYRAVQSIFAWEERLCLDAGAARWKKNLAGRLADRAEILMH